MRALCFGLHKALFYCYNEVMNNINTDLQKQIEERIRIERIKKQTRACKDKLYETCKNQLRQK